MTYRATRPPQQGGWDLLKEWASREFVRVQQAFQRMVSADRGSFTPTFTFSTPGDLSNSYSLQRGEWWLHGDLVFIVLELSVTPTFSTSSGGMLIGGLPFPQAMVASINFEVQFSSTGLTLPGGRTDVYAYLPNGETTLHLAAQGSAIASTQLQPADYTSGVATNSILVTGFYPIK